ncbi:MAG TPA: von Willebrand factor type A domain-containing protein [Chthoniobacterales bacterium]|jgi:hypothetical protein
MNPDDPKLTDYALGELSEPERKLVEKQLRNSPDAQAFVTETRELAATLKSAYKEELEMAKEEPSNVLPLPYARLFWSERRWPTFAVAALLIGSLLIAAVALWRTIPSRRLASERTQAPNEVSDAVTIEYSRDDDGAVVAEAEGQGERPFITVSEKPISTFPMRLGANSYPVLRKLIEAGIRPGKDVVRIEEMINHFNYTYPEPPSARLVGVTVDAAVCPWADGHFLVRIGVNFRESSADAHSSEDVTDLIRRSLVDVQFNPAFIQSYRILGYDAALSQSADGSNPNGPAGERHKNITALYELVPLGNQKLAATNSASKELLKARIRSDRQDGFSAEASLTERPVRFEDAPADFRFAAAVAEFGMILRDSRYKGEAALPAVIQWANAAKGEDRDGERMAFVECARKAQSVL